MLDPSDHRLAERMADIARRIRPAASSIPDQEFDALVRHMAEIELKYVMRAARTGGRDDRERAP